eukprot:2090831-Rhodomonas_salina.4
MYQAKAFQQLVSLALNAQVLFYPALYQRTDPCCTTENRSVLYQRKPIGVVVPEKIQPSCTRELTSAVPEKRAVSCSPYCRSPVLIGPYAQATLFTCPAVASPYLLRACYGMSSTDAGYAATRPAISAISLRSSYAMSSTDPVYRATRSRFSWHIGSVNSVARVWGIYFRVQGSGFRVQGSGFR